MSRIARVVAVGLPHHITQRGNYRQDVFVDAQDRKKYLFWIQEYSTRYGVSILAYCLMPNHVHFIAIPDKDDSLAKTFNAAHMRYSQYFNKRREQNGHLWQGRFYSCALDQPHLIFAARYIELNPVRAGLVQKALQWRWSSAGIHAFGSGLGPVKLGDLFGLIGMTSENWTEYLDQAEERSFLQGIRKNTLTGRPLGSAVFIQRLEAELKRKLDALPVGRPKRN